MDMNKELTWELKAAYWKITRLATDDGARMRLARGGTSTVVAKVLQGMQMEDHGFAEAQSMKLLGV